MQFGTDTYLRALKEILKGIEKRIRRLQDFNTRYAGEENVGKLLEEHTSGLIYNWGPVILLAGKKMG